MKGDGYALNYVAVGSQLLLEFKISGPVLALRIVYYSLRYN